MDLDLILLGLAGGATAYLFVDNERSLHIDKVTNDIITDSCYRRTDGRPLRLPAKESFKVSGYSSYKAAKRYEKVYAALQEKGDNADARELEELFKVE